MWPISAVVWACGDVVYYGEIVVFMEAERNGGEDGREREKGKKHIDILG